VRRRRRRRRRECRECREERGAWALHIGKIYEKVCMYIDVK
jgi:hypothetical protein